MGDFRKFYKKWGKKVQKLGIIFQIDDEKCLYFMHCVLTAELLFLLTYYALNIVNRLVAKIFSKWGESGKEGRWGEKTKWGFWTSNGGT